MNNQHALIKFTAHFATAEIIATGSESAMIAAHAKTPVGDGFFYSVRPADHEMTVAAAEMAAAKLTKRQAGILKALALAAPAGRSIKPGNRKLNSTDGERWGWAAQMVGIGHIYTGDIPAAVKPLGARGYVTVSGLDYAPKSYSVTPIGRIVADALNVQINA
jgi:hypothetical protein